MKSILSTFGIVLCSSLSIHSQVQIDFNSVPGSPQLLLKEMGNDQSRLYFQNSNSLSGEYWSLTGLIAPSDANSEFRMYFNGNASSGEVMTLTGERRVGIGTGSPGARLTLKQDFDQDNNGFRIVDATNNHSGRIWMNGGDFHIQKGENGLNGLVIEGAGKIGVFTDSPQAKFDIYASDESANDDLFLVRKALGIITDAKLFEVQSDLDVYAFRLGVNVEDPDAQLHINTSSASVDPLRVQIDGSTKLRVRSNGGTAIGSNSMPPLNGLYVNGNVHIGTVTGSTDYKMAVNGKIICEELRVQLYSEWPDFVFSDQYDLTSPDELRGYISKHQHLPGIPAADEMHEQGIAVSEMMTTLVQKIEELTLYILDQDTRIKALEHKLIESQK